MEIIGVYVGRTAVVGEGRLARVNSIPRPRDARDRHRAYTPAVQRDAASHKGQNGTVAVIGGSRLQHGAPLFAALAAEAAGVDVLHVCVPRCHGEVAKSTSLNFQVHAFAGDDLAAGDIAGLLELLATMDCAVVGPGIARDAPALAALRTLVAEAPCPLVLDASALQPWTLEAAAGKHCLVTPHAGEMERMRLALENAPALASAHGVTMLLKGVCDTVVERDGTVRTIAGGNAGLTVGGTGDALAGCCCGLHAQGMPMASAAATASKTIKAAGDRLVASHGFAYTTRDVIGCIPALLAAA